MNVKNKYFVALFLNKQKISSGRELVWPKSPLLDALDQGSPNYGPRAKSGPSRDFVNNEKMIYLRNTCWFDRM